MTAAVGEQVRLGTATGRWVIAATVLGSGIAFLDSTVVNVALPAISEDLGGGVTGVQWTLDAYLVTLTSLLLFGGSLGDRYGRRRIFIIGLIAFGITSVACGAAPTIEVLNICRALQGAAAALLVPSSLAIIAGSFAEEDRGAAIGAWSGLAGVAAALGPFVGGWLIDAVSWRPIFLINVPLVIVALYMAVRHVPESFDPAEQGQPPDIGGATLVTLGLAGLAYALIEGPATGGTLPIVLGIAGAVMLVLFVLVERAITNPLLPMGVFRSRQFTGANLTTLAVYAGLGGAMFLVVVQLQVSMGFSALAAGASLLPVTILMFLFSSKSGRLAQRIGPRLPMTIGPFIVACALALFTRVQPGTSWWTTVLPAALVFGAGLVITVAPLTGAVLAAVEPEHSGVASGVNNAVARLAGLLAVAVLPGVAGIEGGLTAESLDAGYATAMWISAAICAVGGVIAFATIRTTAAVRSVAQAAAQPCQHPCIERTDAAQRPAA